VIPLPAFQEHETFGKTSLSHAGNGEILIAGFSNGYYSLGTDTIPRWMDAEAESVGLRQIERLGENSYANDFQVETETGKCMPK